MSYYRTVLQQVLGSHCAIIACSLHSCSTYMVFMIAPRMSHVFRRRAFVAPAFSNSKGARTRTSLRIRLESLETDGRTLAGLFTKLDARMAALEGAR